MTVLEGLAASLLLIHFLLHFTNRLGGTEGLVGHDNLKTAASGYLCVDTLVRDLPRDLIGANGLLNGRPPKAEIGADEGERYGDAEPEGEQRHQREERNGRRAPVIPQHLRTHKISKYEQIN